MSKLSIEEFAFQAVGFARKELALPGEMVNPLKRIVEYPEPIQFVIEAWGKHHPGVTLPSVDEARTPIISALLEECPSLRNSPKFRS